MPRERARSPLNRREFLTALAGAVATVGAGTGVLAATRLSTAATASAAGTAATTTPSATGNRSPLGRATTPVSATTPVATTPVGTHPASTGHPGAAPHPSATAHPSRPARSPLGPGVHHVSGLPGTSPRLAITIDDGDDSAVLGAFIQFAKDSGTRLTFFPNGVYAAWTEHRAALAPLIESGQAQLGNHTWSHPRITTLTDAAVADQIRRNDAFLHRTFGVDAAPWFRPPYGLHDARTDAVAADLGYNAVVTWNGVFDDSSVHLTAAQIVANARQWFLAGRIVLGHANHPPVTTVYGQLLDIIRSRHLRTVTLADVYGA